MSEDEDGQSDLDEDEDTQDAINESLHDMSVNEKVLPRTYGCFWILFKGDENADENAPSTSGRGRKKRGRTSESEQAPKRARAQDVAEAFDIDETGEGASISVTQSVPVSAEKAAMFQERLNKIFMEKREQVATHQR